MRLITMIEMTYSIYVQNFTMCEYLMVDIVPLPIDAIHVCVTVGSDPIAIRATPHKASIIDKENLESICFIECYVSY